MSKNFHEMYPKLNGLDARSMSYLSSAIEKANQKGFDYFEFRRSVSNLATMMDEEMAIKSAFTTGASIGLTKERLLGSIDHYKKVLLSEKKQFDEALNNQIAQRVNQKRSQKEKMKAEIEKLQARMEEYKKKIDKMQDSIDRSDSEIEQAEQKIDHAKAQFEKAYDRFVHALQEDYSHIDRVI